VSLNRQRIMQRRLPFWELSIKIASCNVYTQRGIKLAEGTDKGIEFLSWGPLCCWPLLSGRQQKETSCNIKWIRRCETHLCTKIERDLTDKTWEENILCGSILQLRSAFRFSNLPNFLLLLNLAQTPTSDCGLSTVEHFKWQVLVVESLRICNNYTLINKCYNSCH
jgi:hypothetical protein